MKIHHLSCATLCPRGSKLFTGEGGYLREGHLTAHCLLIEAGDELILVDTGFGTADVADPKRLGQPFRALIRPRVTEAETAIRQIEGLGLDPGDVRHIIATHLDVDHAGGLGDFPEAKVHVFAPELEMALSPTLTQKQRYVQAHWEHGPEWSSHPTDGEEWFGFESVRPVESVDADIALVPLIGHSAGHSAVAVRDDRGWLLHCGDGYFHRHEVETPPSAPAGIKFFQAVVGWNGKKRKRNQERLRELAREHGDEVRLACSHDRHELEREQASAAARA